ncbi:hypothetical protein FACS1894139_13890 [Planctomycetales bacterium]|nr:hypothetical protein FACS1894139_13890 [Planctomycetales bacterium]
MSWREKILRTLARLACRRCKTILLAALALTVLAVAVMLRQGYTTSFNIARMLPQNIPAARAFTQSLTDFGAVDEAMMVFWLNPDDPRAILNAGGFADQVVAQLQSNPDINNVFSRLLTDAEKQQLLHVELPKHGMLLLQPDDLQKIKDKLAPAAIDRALDNTVRKLTTIDADSPAGEAVLLDALGLAQIFQGRFENLLGKKPDDSEKTPTVTDKKARDHRGYLVSPDERMLLIIAQPKFAAQNVRFSQRLMRYMEDTVYDLLVGAAPLTACPPELCRALATAPLAKLRESLDKNSSLQLAALTAEALAPDTEDRRLLLTALNDALRLGKFLPPAVVAENEKKVAALTALGFDKNLARRAYNLAAGREFLRAAGLPLAENPAPTPSGTLKSFRVEFAGGYQISRRYAEKVNGVMLGTLALSGVLVLLFFGWCFRRMGVLLYIGIPLLMIITWTGGIGWLLFGQLNLISCAFAAVLVGLGVDYAVHIYNRYVEERSRGATVEAAFETAIVHTGWGVMVGMLTTCVAFIALVTSRFDHLAEFGALGALGILLSAPVMMLVMPALITLRNHWRPENLRIFKPSEFYLPAIVNFTEKHLRLVFVGGLVAAFIALTFILLPDTLRFDPSMAALRPRDRAFEINGEIARAFSTRNPNKLNFIVSAPTEAAALEKAAAYENKLRALQEQGLIIGYESVTQFLPPPSAQKRLLAQMRGMDLDGAARALQAALEKRQLDPSYFAFNARLLAQHATLAQDDRVLLPSDFRDSKIARLLGTMVARKQTEFSLRHGIPPSVDFPITLAKAATTNDSDRQIYPAGATLTRADVLKLIPPNPEETDKVYGLTYYANGYAVKATVYPPVPENSRDGEFYLTREWLAQVAAGLGLDAAQFAAVENARDFDAVLTGVPIASLVLADIVKEDFLRIAICIALICFGTINLFYHPSPGRALACSLPVGIFALARFLYPQWLPEMTGQIIYAALALLFVGGALAHREIGRVGYCFLPVATGLLYMFGLMALLNFLSQALGGGDLVNLNFVNVLTIPIIIGVGVDNGIHLVQRYYESGRDIRPMVVDTGRALVITGLTSIVAFGSLYLSKFQGLDSIAQLGTLSMLAFFMVLAASLVFFPAFISVLSPKKKP